MSTALIVMIGGLVVIGFTESKLIEQAREENS